MKTVVRLIVLSVSLALLACAARAQPAAPPAPPKDEPCHTAGRRYFWAFENRTHMSVEQVHAAALDAGRKYPRLCGRREDAFTRHVRAAVAAAEAARRCEVKTWPLYSKRVEVADSATREQRRQAYEAAEEFLRLCRHYGNLSTSRAERRVEEYGAALRVEEAEKTLASLVPAARAAPPGSTGPETYARIAEAYAVARVRPSLLRYVRLSGREMAGRREEETPAGVREARAQFHAGLDRVIDAYARALASCGGRGSCGVSEALWKRQIGIYYAHRRVGDGAGLEETIARALDAPMPDL